MKQLGVTQKQLGDPGVILIFRGIKKVCKELHAKRGTAKLSTYI